MHRKNELGLVLSISLIAIMLAGVFAIPVGRAAYTTFEQYGPNVNQILIKLYANQQIEFNDFELGAIDMVDWPLDKYWIDRWTNNPNIVMQDYGGEIGMREFDINVNGTRGICSAGGTDQTIMQPNIGTVLEFRQAVAYLVDRAYIITSILQGFGTAQYTFVPAALGGYVNTNVDKHQYSPSTAASVLAAGGIRDTDGDGFFDWPNTPMGSSNKIIVDFCLRVDDTPGRNEAGKRLIWEMTTNIRAYSGGVGFYIQEWDASGSVGARKWWMAGKGAVIYTGGWSLSRDPDFLYDLFHSSMYYNPGRPPNVAHVADPELDGYLEGIKFAETAAAVMTNTLEAQRVMADKVWVVPVWVASAPKAVRAAYTGGTNGNPVSPDDGENQYRGKAWQGFANLLGTGLNSWFSTLGAHVNDANGAPMDGGVLRYGFKVPVVNSFNPVYSEWVWDWEVLGRAYDSFFAVNPYDLSEDLEWIAKRWEVGVWTVDSGPNMGLEATKLIFEMRDDVYWHDGVKLTADDIVFTDKTLVDTLDARGLPPPWYYGSLLDVNKIVKVNDYKVEVYMNSKSYFALHWIGGVIILPEHIWLPIVTSGDPTTFSPDPQIIGAGPFKVYPHSIQDTAGDYYVPNQYILLDAYKGSGYFNGHPIFYSKAVHGSNVDVYLQNRYEASISGIGVSMTAQPMTRLKTSAPATTVKVATPAMTSVKVASSIGATRIYVMSTAGYAVNDWIVIGLSPSDERRQVAAIGADATGPYFDLSLALSYAHSVGEPVGLFKIYVVSATGFNVNDLVLIGVSTSREKRQITGLGSDARGSYFYLDTALTYAHSVGDPVGESRIHVESTRGFSVNNIVLVGVPQETIQITAIGADYFDLSSAPTIFHSVGEPVISTVTLTLTPTPLGPYTVPGRVGSSPGNITISFGGLLTPYAEYKTTVTVSYTFAGGSIADTFDSVYAGMRGLIAPTVVGDIKNDGAVNVLDAIHLSFHFGLKAWIWPEDDINADGRINVQDSLVLIANWGRTAS